MLLEVQKEKIMVYSDKKMEALNNASHKLAEAMYKNTNAEQPGADPTGGQQQNSAPGSEPQQESQDNVVDAEFEETDKE